jgi:hypothetical protein
MSKDEISSLLNEILAYWDRYPSGICGCIRCSRSVNRDYHLIGILQANKLAYLLRGIGIDPLVVKVNNERVFFQLSQGNTVCFENYIGLTYGFESHLTREQIIKAILSLV